MAYVLNSVTIRRPTSFAESNNSMHAEVKTLTGKVSRDYFGANKRIWTLEYRNLTATAFTTIKNIYDAFVLTDTPVPFYTTEVNDTITQTNVYIDLQERNFHIRGSTFLSDFTLILTEA